MNDMCTLANYLDIEGEGNNEVSNSGSFTTTITGTEVKIKVTSRNSITEAQ